MKRISKPLVIGGSDLKDVVDGARRSFLMKSSMGLGLGAVAAADLLGGTKANATITPAGGSDKVAPNLGIRGTGEYPARAKRVIYIHLLGANSTVDLWDHKPLLTKMHGQPMPQ